MEYNLSDWVLSGLKFLLNTIILPIRLLYPQIGAQETGEEENPDPSETSPPSYTSETSETSHSSHPSPPSLWKKITPYLRGVLLAVPVLAILTSLLAAADPIFADWVKNLLNFIRLENFFRAIYIAILTFPVAGGYLYALIKSQDEKLTGVDKPWPPRFLGFIESTIVLGSVNVLFFSFVLIQFQYFFGGESNISLEGYTYAEYARRGFGELLAVAFFALLLFIVLSAISKREKKGQRGTFSILTVALTLFIGVILVSSLHRLGLYEEVYGFTRLRTYSHICILWIGLLFLGILILELAGQWRSFTLAALFAVMGFTLTLNAINVDAFITRHNLARSFQGEKLDANYLRSLSNDAVPTLTALGDDDRLSTDAQGEIARTLACRAALWEKPQHWQSFHWSVYQAQKALQAHHALWDEIPTYKDEYQRWHVISGGEDQVCSFQIWD